MTPVHVKDSDGGWSVGIHIADVSHYVKPGGALDREALRRGNSVYLPGPGAADVAGTIVKHDLQLETERGSSDQVGFCGLDSGRPDEIVSVCRHGNSQRRHG